MVINLIQYKVYTFYVYRMPYNNLNLQKYSVSHKWRSYGGDLTGLKSPRNFFSHKNKRLFHSCSLHFTTILYVVRRTDFDIFLKIIIIIFI